MDQTTLTDLQTDLAADTIAASNSFSNPVIVNNSGTLSVSAGSTILLTPVDCNFSALTGNNVPSGVIIGLENFQSGNPISISLTNSSTTNQATVSGTEKFIAVANYPASNATMTITSASGLPGYGFSC